MGEGLKRVARRLPVDELTRRAFYYAVMDRRGYLDAIEHTDMADEIAETKALIEQLEARLRDKWGTTFLH